MVKKSLRWFNYNCLLSYNIFNTINVLISIIIPTYNNLYNLKDCLKSIKKQTFKNFEVWIIDNNSSDGTIEFLKNLEKPFNWISKSDKGIYDAMNHGIKKSNGKWLYFLGSDDKFFEETTLESIFKNKYDTSVKIIIGSIKYNTNHKDSFLLKKNEGVFKSSWSNKIWIKNTIHHQSIFYRKEIFENRLYDLNYSLLADYDLNLHLYKIKTKVCLLNRIIAITGTQGVSKQNNWNIYKEEIKIKENLYSSYFKPVFVIIAISKYALKKLF